MLPLDENNVTEFDMYLPEREELIASGDVLIVSGRRRSVANIMKKA